MYLCISSDVLVFLAMISTFVVLFALIFKRHESPTNFYLLGIFVSITYYKHIHIYINYFTNTVYCKSFEVEKFCRFCGSIGKRETFTVKHFHLVLKMVGHGPGFS